MTSKSSRLSELLDKDVSVNIFNKRGNKVGEVKGKLYKIDGGNHMVGEFPIFVKNIIEIDPRNNYIQYQAPPSKQRRLNPLEIMHRRSAYNRR